MTANKEVVEYKQALVESTNSFQHRLMTAKELLEEAQSTENISFKEVHRLQEKMTETMVRMAKDEDQEKIRLKKAEELASQGASIIGIDQVGIVTDYNAAAETVFGYSPAEVLGQNVTMLMSKAVAMKHERLMDEFLTTGQSHTMGVKRSIQAVAKNGSRFNADLIVKDVRPTEAGGAVNFTCEITKPQTEEMVVAQRELALKLAAEYSESQNRMANWLTAYQKDYRLAERLWKEHSLETAEVRAQIQDLVVERNDDIETFSSGGVHRPENTKPAPITEEDISAAYRLPLDHTRPALIQSSYPKVSAYLATSPSPTQYHHGGYPSTTSPPRGDPALAVVDEMSPADRRLNTANSVSAKIGVSHNVMPAGLQDDDLQAAFEMLDTNNNGVLSVEELQAGYFDGQFGTGGGGSDKFHLPGCKDFVAKQVKRLPRKANQPPDTVNFQQFAILAIKWAAM